MRALLLAVQKDVLRWIRSPLMAIVFLIFPVLFAFVIGLAFGNGDEGTLAPIRLALVDEDEGLATRLISSALSRGAGDIHFEVLNLALPQATRMIEADKISAILRIPAGFTDSLLAGGSTSLYLIKNPAQSIYPQIAEEFVSVLALAGNSGVRILQEPLSEIKALSRGRQNPPDQVVAGLSVAIGHRIRGVGRYLLPPAISLERASTGKDQKSNYGGNPLAIALFVLPGMASFSLLTLAMTSMGDLRHEETMGTLARQFTAPAPTWACILGKAVATILLALTCILVLSLVAVFMLKARVSLPGFITLALAFSVAATGFATLAQSLFSSERTGTALASIVLMVMAMFGGSWIPLNSLPAGLRAIAPLTLNYWANEGFRKLLFEGAGPGALLPNLAVLLGLAAAFAVISVLLIRRRFLRGV